MTDLRETIAHAIWRNEAERAAPGSFKGDQAMSMQHKIATIIDDMFLDGPDATAKAIIAALPGGVNPLVWEDQRAGAYAWPLGLHYYTDGEADDWCVACMIGDFDIWHSDNLSTLEAAKSSADAHYRATVMAAFGLPGDGND